MSFRIDDILRKETDVKSNVASKMNCETAEQTLLNYNDPFRVVPQEELQRPGSLLQQTLQYNKNAFCNSAFDSDFNRNYWNYDCSKFYATQYMEPYYEKERTGLTSYRSSNLWSSVYSHLPVYLPYLQYNKRKGGQVRFSVSQTDALERRFHANKYLSPEDRKILADTLKLSDRQVKTWFQNRRAKWRRSNSTGNSMSDGDGISLDNYEEISVLSDVRSSNDIKFHSSQLYPV